MCNRRGLWRDEAGSSAVEFALLAATFFTFLFGVFQVGLALHYGASVRWALETSARTLMLDPTTTQSQLRTQVLSYLSDVPGSSGVTVTLVKDTANKTFTANSGYAYPMSIPFLPAYNMQFNARVVVPTP